MTPFRIYTDYFFIIALFTITNRTSCYINAFEYELPNRTVTICPTYSLFSIECPQIPPSYTDHHHWQTHLPQYLISIDYIRSFPSRLGHDPTTCQPDLSHSCHSYDLRYINTLCNGKAQCPDIPAYQIRDRSLCAFKAVTEIGYHCVPTWHLRDIQTKCDICKNGSLTNDYGFIYSRNYPLQTARLPCFTTIYARPNHRTVLYFVNGELNHDQLRIESVSSEGVTILNITLNGNQTTQRLAMSNYEMKITFLPSHIYSHQPTYYLLYFYTVPLCSYTDPCSIPSHTTTPLIIPSTFTTTTSRMRVQSVGWSRISNIWIIIPVILAYILLLLLIIILALLFQRRRKQQKALAAYASNTLSSRYFDANAMSSRTQLVSPITIPPPPPPPLMNSPGGVVTQSMYRCSSTSQNLHYPFAENSFARNMERYHRESRSDFDLHQNALNSSEYRYRHPDGGYHGYRGSVNHGLNRSYGTIDYGSRAYSADRRRSLPKSFSDCNLCKRQIHAEDIYEERDDNWRLENSVDRHDTLSKEPRAYRERIKERVRERLSVRQIPDSDPFTASSGTVEYSTVLPRHQRFASESGRSNMGPVQSLPFEYIPSDSSSNVRTVEYKRNGNEERLVVGNSQQTPMTDDYGSTNFTVKFYQRDDDDEDENEMERRLDRCLHEAREVQEMSMRMSEQQQQQQHYVNRHQYYQQQQQQQRRYNGNADI